MPFDILNPDEQQQMVGQIASAAAQPQQQVQPTAQPRYDDQQKQILEQQLQNPVKHGFIGRALLPQDVQDRDIAKQKLDTLSSLKEIQDKKDALDPTSSMSRQAQGTARVILSTTAQQLGRKLPDHVLTDIDKMSASQLQAIKQDPTGEVVKAMTQGSKNDVDIAKEKINAGNAQAKAGQQEYDKAIKANADFIKMATTGGRGVSTTIGRALARRDDIDNLGGLLQAIDAGQINANGPVNTDLAIATVRMLSGGNVVSEKLVHDLKQRSAETSLKEAFNFLTGSTIPVITPDFVKQMHSIHDREQSTWANKLDQYTGGLGHTMDQYWSKYPELKKSADSAVRASQGDSSDSTTPQRPAGVVTKVINGVPTKLEKHDDGKWYPVGK